MSVSAEFIVNLGPYEHVKLTLSDDNLMSIYGDSKESFEEWLGDYHASLKAAVLYGRDQALRVLDAAEWERSGKPVKASPPESIPLVVEDDPETALEGAVEALAEGLGATVLGEEEKPSEAPSSPSSRPWKNKPKAKKQQPWEDPIQDGPDATPEEAVAATKAARKAAAASDWDF